MRKHPFIALISFLLLGFSSEGRAQSPTLETHVRDGLASNNGLKQQQLLLDKSLYALEEAKGLFLPTVNFGGTYTLADGGRKSALPVGDLLNPVYSTLNQLTQSQAFPQIANQEIAFLPNNFYDFRFRTVQPLVNMEISYNKRIKGEQINLQRAEIQVYKRELAKNIKQAYFQYAQAMEAQQIYGNALVLLQENKRVSESLVKNGAGNPASVMRAESEIAKVEGQLIELKANQQNAAAYFNFLLNRPLGSPIAPDAALTTTAQPSSPTVDTTAIANREELDKLRTAAQINQLVLDMDRAYHMPKVGVQLDLGSQAFNFQWGGYVLAGLSIDVPLYAGNRNENKIKQAQADLAALQAQTEQVEDQLLLQATTAANTYNAAIKSLDTKAPQVAAMQRYYRDTMRRYKEGQANYIELLDARTELTQAEMQQSLARTAVWLKWVELERAIGAQE